MPRSNRRQQVQYKHITTTSILSRKTSQSVSLDLHKIFLCKLKHTPQKDHSFSNNQARSFQRKAQHELNCSSLAEQMEQQHSKAACKTLGCQYDLGTGSQLGSEIQNKQDQTTIAAIIINKQADQQPHSPVHFQQSTQEIEIKQSRSSSLNLQKFPPLKLKHNPLDNHFSVTIECVLSSATTLLNVTNQCAAQPHKNTDLFFFLYFAKKESTRRRNKRSPIKEGSSSLGRRGISQQQRARRA